MEGRSKGYLLDEESNLNSLIFLPFSNTWNFFIGITSVVVYVLCTHVMSYPIMLDDSQISFIIYPSDILYLIDFGLSLAHYFNKGISKLRNFPQKHWLFLVIDAISLIPLEIVYLSIFEHRPDEWSNLKDLELLNRCLRIYRIYLVFLSLNSRIMLWPKYPLILFCEFFFFTMLISHTLSCLSVLLGMESRCSGGNLCVFGIEGKWLFFTLNRWKGRLDEDRYAWYQKLLLTIGIIIGHVLDFGYIKPRIILVLMKTNRSFVEFYQRFKIIKTYCKNNFLSTSLKNEVLSYYTALWENKHEITQPDLLKTVPLSLNKDLHLDIFWEALRHSEILSAVSRSCKRDLSLKMRCEFYKQGRIVLDRDEHKNKMIYLVKGVLQIMADENDESSVISFSNGTVLGEFSLFYSAQSKAIMKAATDSEIFVLYSRDFFSVLLNYPADKKKCFTCLERRIMIAQLTQWRKQEYQGDVGMEGEEEGEKLQNDSIKWIKKQWRALSEMQKRFRLVVKCQESGEKIPSWSKNFDMQPSILHTSTFIHLLVLSDSVEVKTDVTCLRPACPWIISSDSRFLVFWRSLVLLTVVLTSLINPIVILCYPFIPIEFSTTLFCVSVGYATDLYLSCITVARTNEGLITKPSSILTMKLATIPFYLDVLAAIPLPFLLRLFNSPVITLEYYEGMATLNLLAKVYRIHHFFLSRRYNFNNSYLKMIMLEFIFFFLLSIYWLYCLSILQGRHKLFGDANWYDQIVAFFEEHLHLFMPLVYALSLAIPFQSPYIAPITRGSIALALITTCFYYVYTTFWLGTYTACYILGSLNETSFHNCMDKTRKYMNLKHISPQTQAKVMDMFNFQWNYDAGSYIMTGQTNITDAPAYLAKKVRRQTIFPSLKRSLLFHMEFEEFVDDVSECARILAIPAGIHLFTFGTQPMYIYLIHRGYCQVNSFLPGDVKDGLAYPSLYGPGKLFPMLITCLQLPTSVSAITLTDCEVLVINFESYLSVAIKRKALRDVFEAAMETEIKEFENPKYALEQAKVAFNEQMSEYESYYKPFKESKLGFLRFILLKKCINANGVRYKRWERWIFIAVFLNNFFLPMAHGLLIYNKYLPYFALFHYMTAWTDIYIRLHVTYYTEEGIQVFHPLYAAKHYLSHSFCMDLFPAIPFYFIIYYSIYGGREGPYLILVIIFDIIANLTRFYRVFGYFTYRESISKSEGFNKVLKYIFLVLITIVVLTNVHMKMIADWYQDENGNYIGFELNKDYFVAVTDILKPTTPYEFYCIVLYAYVSAIAHCEFFVRTSSKIEYTYFCFLNFVGSILFIYIATKATSSTKSSVVDLLVYHDRMRSFLHFITSEQADDDIAQRAIEHFEHVWSKTRGNNLKRVFSRFPVMLHEEMMYMQYRKTFGTVSCFAGANEAFYKILSTTVEEIYLTKGSSIIFLDQVQPYIFFIHLGKCQVPELNINLQQGTLFGDLKNTGKMDCNINAFTHVTLLRISMSNFQKIVNNFEEVETKFKQKQNELTYDFLTETSLSTEMSDISDNEYDYTAKRKYDFGYFAYRVHQISDAQYEDGAKALYLIYPDTRVSNILNLLFLFTAYLTCVSLSILIFIERYTYGERSIVLTFDVIWCVKIVATFRTVISDRQTGFQITSIKSIAARYLLSYHGLVVDVLTVIPTELSFLVTDDFKWIVFAGRVLKFLRLLYIIHFFSVRLSRLKVSSVTRIGSIFVTDTLLLFAAIGVCNSIGDYEWSVPATGNAWTEKETTAVVSSALYVTSQITGAGVESIVYKNYLQVSFTIAVSCLSLCMKTLLLAEVLALISIMLHKVYDYTFNLRRLKDYLQVHYTSPSLQTTVIWYVQEMVLNFQTEAMPTFLLESPPTLKIALMEDLYARHLQQCYIFSDLPTVFLRQLAARLMREIYFPGFVIVEKNDVDHSMFFIHSGEINVIDTDNTEFEFEVITDTLITDRFFGIDQGLWECVAHIHTYKARTISEILRLKASEWSDLRLAFPHVVKTIYNRARRVTNF